MAGEPLVLHKSPLTGGRCMSSRSGVCAALPRQPAPLTRLVCLEQGASRAVGQCHSSGYFLALAAEELIACLSFLLFLLIGHLWFLFQENFCLLSWMFWLRVFKQGVCLTTGIALGGQNDKVL